MKQNSVLESTKKVTEMPLEFTRSVMEQSKRLSNPSPKVAKIGTAVGSTIGAGLLLAGTVQILTSKPLWAIGSISAGAITIVSNFIYYHRKKS